MKIKKITQLINSLHNSDISYLKLEQENTKIIINQLKSKVLPLPQNYKKEYKKEQKHIKELNKNINNNIETSKTYSTIVSPMVGTFYKSPAPNEPAFIEIGETVKPKQTVCIIEAMKLMNEIESEVKGEIVDILVKDGDIVECGQALMKIKTI
uniref:Biotin carboxyl carrier protein of acetyl-CoA carboxylase n=1 Tax=Polysiphonia sp. TaxID=1967842 RepID=A0A1Z1MUJ9_9FLOR|nr:acetyl-CoA carboxylase biotin carboxyl carrier protein [Polysiphonia sp.]